MPDVDHGVAHAESGNGAVSPDGLAARDRVARLLATFTRASEDLAVLAAALDALQVDSVEASFATDVMQRRIQRLDDERTALRTEVTELTGRLQAMRGRVRELEAELAVHRP